MPSALHGYAWVSILLHLNVFLGQNDIKCHDMSGLSSGLCNDLKVLYFL